MRLADEDRPDRPGLLVAPETPGARQAVTRVRREAAGMRPAGVLWLRLWPETGRTHQLRAQAAARGMPILGDSEYGSRPRSGAAHHRAACAVARGPAPHPPDAMTLRRARSRRDMAETIGHPAR